MIRCHSHKQLSLAEFDWPFQSALDENNRWVKMSRCIPWDELSEGYYQSLSVRQGRPAKDARLVIAAVIIKHKLCLSDEETVAQIQENPYLQYFAGLSGYQMQAPFAPSLLVEVRKRMGQEVYLGRAPLHEVAIHPDEAVAIIICASGCHGPSPSYMRTPREQHGAGPYLA